MTKKTAFPTKSARCAVLALLLSLAAPGMAQFVPDVSRAELTVAASGNRKTTGFWIFRKCRSVSCPGFGAYCCGNSV